MFLSLYSISILGMFHMESMWNEYTWNGHGIHCSKYLIYMSKHIPYGIHVESMEYVHSTWIPYGMWGGGKVNFMRLIY